VGALQQWIPLQEDYECFFLIADVQALTTHMEQPDLIQRSVRDVVLDWLSVGLDPSKDNVNFVLQSAIPELTELTAYLSMVTPFTWMERNPTIRAEKKR
jgi:tryptophanyl-tRNA synthetase